MLSNKVLSIYKIFGYVVFIPLALIDLYVIAYNIRYPYWAITGYTDSFNKGSVIYFLYDKNPYYAALYLFLIVALIAFPFLLSLIFLKKRPFIALLLAMLPYFIQFLFHYEDMCWKWVNDNIYDFGFYLM